MSWGVASRNQGDLERYKADKTITRGGTITQGLNNNSRGDSKDCDSKGYVPTTQKIGCRVRTREVPGGGLYIQQ